MASPHLHAHEVISGDPIVIADDDTRPRKVRRNIHSCVECELSISSEQPEIGS
jgi:hypothetical protein